MELKHYVKLARESLSHLSEEEWNGDSVIGVKITPVRREDFEDAAGETAADADEAPWEGEDELPKGETVSPSEAAQAMIAAMESLETALERVSSAIAEDDLTHGEMIAMAHEAGELAREMTKMYESIRAWQ